jgi:hypothetical protein
MLAVAQAADILLSIAARLDKIDTRLIDAQVAIAGMREQQLSEIERLRHTSDEVRALSKDVRAVLNDVIEIKTRSSVWGAAAGVFFGLCSGLISRWVFS